MLERFVLILILVLSPLAQVSGIGSAPVVAAGQNHSSAVRTCCEGTCCCDGFCLCSLRPAPSVPDRTDPTPYVPSRDQTVNISLCVAPSLVEILPAQRADELIPVEHERIHRAASVRAQSLLCIWRT